MNIKIKLSACKLLWLPFIQILQFQAILFLILFFAFNLTNRMQSEISTHTQLTTRRITHTLLPLQLFSICILFSIQRYYFSAARAFVGHLHVLKYHQALNFLVRFLWPWRCANTHANQNYHKKKTFLETVFMLVYRNQAKLKIFKIKLWCLRKRNPIEESSAVVCVDMYVCMETILTPCAVSRQLGGAEQQVCC